MNWEDIQSKLRRRLGYLFSDQQSIRSLVLDVDSELEGFIVWNGRAVDCWSGILREVRIRHKELRLIDSALLDYPEDETLKQAKQDFLLLQQASIVIVPPIKSVIPPSKPADSTGAIEVFISYSEDDEKFMKQLETHLSPLKREEVIRPWHKQQIKIGEGEGHGDLEIAKHIDSAQIILLLMSPSFVASDQLYEDQMMRAINRQRSGDPVRVIPIAVRHIAPGDPDKTPYQKIQGLPRNGRPIDTSRNPDEAWALIAQEIRAVCNDLRGK
jgi:hypothetical protein